jgi:exosortase A-associated hydrolase 1
MGDRMRRVITFSCGGEMLVGTLDEAAGTTGLLIVSGGNEIRIGAHRGMTALAANLARSGTPVFRYDRRGIGDSSGENEGFERSAEDMAAAVAAFRAAVPTVTRIVGFGNCDAATALALFHRQAGIDALVLANPWTIDRADDLPPAAAIRARYVERLKDPATYLRLLRGGVDIRKLFRGLWRISERQSQEDDALAVRLAAALSGTTPVTIVLAERDATAIAYADVMHAIDLPVTTHVIHTASHSFARGEDQAALEAILRGVLG